MMGKNAVMLLWLIGPPAIGGKRVLVWYRWRPWCVLAVPLLRPAVKPCKGFKRQAKHEQREHPREAIQIGHIHNIQMDRARSLQS